jgi:hypothetical protein
MKKLAFLALAAMSLTSCWTLIFSEGPTPEPVEPPKTVYTTTVTTPAPKTTTVTTFVVTDYNTDLSFYLDLNAVAAAFAESRSVQEFEQLLNSSRYMINNLDLNRDGWIDYLRVIEMHQGIYHSLLIQACLAPSVFQDVATLVAEHRPDALYVEVIGDRWLYGPNYIVRPVFIKRPPMWDVYGRPSYAAWSSPYYYDHYPSYYNHPKPVYLNHYQAYVDTYMTNHHYCHHCDFPHEPHYRSYEEMTRPYNRNDYQKQHPDNSFERRVTRTASDAGVNVRNAGQLRTEVARQSGKTTESGSVSGRTSGKVSEDRSNPAKTETPNTAGRNSGKETTTTRQTTPSRQPNTTAVETRVKKDGTSRTTVTSTDNAGRTESVKRESSSTRTSGTTNSSSTRTSGTTNSSSTRTSGTSGSTRSSQGSSNESSPRSDRRGR